MSSDVEAYLREANPKVRKLAKRICDGFVAEGCSLYVKTIYIGADFEGEMIGAVYAHKVDIEVALALPEDASHPLLEDASHLTWRTLPVLARVSVEGHLKDLRPLIEEACQRVRSREHNVYLDDDFFIEARRRRGARRIPRRDG